MLTFKIQNFKTFKVQVYLEKKSLYAYLNQIKCTYYNY